MAKCPKCGYDGCQIISETQTKGKDYSVGKGCCGAMVTLILDCAMEPTKRPYTDPYEYCTRCGTCTTRCPVDAISLEHLRNLKKCSGRSGELFKIYKKGNCSKCMVGVPCEDRIPVKADP